MGIGYTICPEASVQRELAEGSLRKLGWNADHSETSVVMIWHVEKWCSPLLRHFLKLCEEVVSR